MHDMNICEKRNNSKQLQRRCLFNCYQMNTKQKLRGLKQKSSKHNEILLQSL